MKPQKLEQVELHEYKPVLYAVMYLHLEAYGTHFISLFIWTINHFTARLLCLAYCAC